MSPKLLLTASMTAVVMATAGGCSGLPGQTPDLPTQIPTELPDGLPTQIPTQLPALPSLPAGQTAAPVPSDGVAAPLPSVGGSDPAPSGSAEPGLVEEAADAVGGVPWWVWALLVLAGLGLVAAIVALRRAKAAELAWAALWHELTGEARWLDERVVPAVQDRSLPAPVLQTRWQDGSGRFDDLDRRVWGAANEERTPARVADLNALSDSLLRLRDAVDAEVSLRTSGYEEPGLPDAAQAVADARDDLRRTVTERTR